MAFVHLGTSVVPNATTTLNEVDKNTTTKVNTPMSSLVEEQPSVLTNVQQQQLEQSLTATANNNNAQCQAEKASALLQDVKNVQDETDHSVHSPTVAYSQPQPHSHNNENLAEPNPIINEQMSCDNSLVVASEATTEETDTILQTVESNTIIHPASNTESEPDTSKPKLIQPTVVRKEKSIKPTQQSQSSSNAQQQAQKKADLDEGKAGSSGNFFT